MILKDQWGKCNESWERLGWEASTSFSFESLTALWSILTWKTVTYKELLRKIVCQQLWFKNISLSFSVLSFSASGSEPTVTLPPSRSVFHSLSHTHTHTHPCDGRWCLFRGLSAARPHAAARSRSRAGGGSGVAAAWKEAWRLGEQIFPPGRYEQEATLWLCGFVAELRLTLFCCCCDDDQQI